MESAEEYTQIAPDLPELEVPSGGDSEPVEHNPLGTIAFGGIILFTLLLYARPNDLYPEVFGTAPIAKVVAIIALLFFIAGKAVDVRPVRWPFEMKAVLGLTFVAIAFMPLATNPSVSFDYLSETWIKVVIIFFLLVNVLTTRKRLRRTIALVVLCSSALAIAAVKDYATGNLNVQSEGFARVGGAVGGIFGDPNDLATTLDMMLPLAIMLGLSRRGFVRVFWFGCALVLAGGVTVTLSRGGFIGLAFTILFLWWKLFQGKRAQGVLVLLLLGLLLVPFIPRTTIERISTLATPVADADGSRQQRLDLLQQGLHLAFMPRRLAVGLGFSNYEEVSLRSHKAHNSYIETLAELGVIGFALYMSLLIAPMRSLRKVEQSADRTRAESDNPRLRETALLTKGLQATLVAYMVCSFFLSIQYSWYLYYPVAFAIALRYLWQEPGGTLPGNPKSSNDDETLTWDSLEPSSGKLHGMEAQ